MKGKQLKEQQEYQFTLLISNQGRWYCEVYLSLNLFAAKLLKLDTPLS